MSKRVRFQIPESDRTKQEFKTRKFCSEKMDLANDHKIEILIKKKNLHKESKNKLQILYAKLAIENSLLEKSNKDLETQLTMIKSGYDEKLQKYENKVANLEETKKILKDQIISLGEELKNEKKKYEDNYNGEQKKLKKDQEFEAKEQELLNLKATCTCHISFDFENVQQNVVIKKEIKQEPPDEDNKTYVMKVQEALIKQEK